MSWEVPQNQSENEIIMKIGKLTCNISKGEGQQVCYILTPMPISYEWMVKQTQERGCSLVVISNLDWGNDLTPWKAPNIFRSEPDFGGMGQKFLKTLLDDVLPKVENHLQITHVERTLIGISLSGLFALWAWMQGDDFKHIASVSGSFWYEGFTEWLQSSVVKKGGKAYLSLGDKEPKQRNPFFKMIGEKTLQTLEILKYAGIDTTFEWNPGNHYVDILSRLEKALCHIYE